MTEKELAGKFTPPDEKLAALRVVLVRVLEDKIREVNRELARMDERSWQAMALTNYRNGITWACWQLRELVDGEGKFLREELMDRTWPMDEARQVEILLKSDNKKEG